MIYVDCNLCTYMDILLGWVSFRPDYCQLIRECNKEKQHLWCLQQKVNNESFDNVIWSDECTVIIERKRTTYRRIGQPRRLKPKPKHPLKLHVWDAISMKGASPLVMFSENLTAVCYGKILETALLPFIRAKFPHNHHFQQDNDPKHTSHYVQDFFDRHGIMWWKTPAESPDLNPIKKVWGSMKNYLRGVHFRDPRNRNLTGLKASIKRFWKTLTPVACSKYINHIHKVIPIVINNKGNASGH